MLRASFVTLSHRQSLSGRWLEVPGGLTTSQESTGSPGTFLYPQPSRNTSCSALIRLHTSAGTPYLEALRPGPCHGGFDSTNSSHSLLFCFQRGHCLTLLRGVSSICLTFPLHTHSRSLEEDTGVLRNERISPKSCI